ncbi:MAG: hypothetical protein HQL01_15515 [Nitrospirae bacterium]|nr:hypothetical protein [Nitrospirota bacterium]
MKTAVHTVTLMLLLLVICPPSWAATEGVAFTRQDRDRLIRLEVLIEEGFKSTNQRIDDGLKSTNQRMEDGFKNINQRMEDGLKSTNQRMEDGFKNINQRINDLYLLMSVMIAGMITLVGFVLWDRRTTLAPATRKIKDLEEREDRVERVLKELAIKDPNAAEANKRAGLL